MSGRSFDRLRGGWTHRRLGLGRTRPSDAALAHVDGVLTEVGGRIPRDLARDLAPDPVRVALLDFVADIDLTIDTMPTASQSFDAQQFDAGQYRRSLMVEMARIDEPAVVSRRTPLRQRLLIPAMSAATAAVVLIAVFVAGRGSNDTTVGTPASAASSESQVLLRHASLLLTAASTASEANRIVLVREARSDLQHVSKLLPLIGAPARPTVRLQLRSLERRAKPKPTTHPSHAAGSTTGSGSTPTKGSAAGSGSSSGSGTGSSSTGSGSTGSSTGSGSVGHGTRPTGPPAGNQPVHHPRPNPTQPPVGSQGPTGHNPTGSGSGQRPVAQGPQGQLPSGPGTGSGNGTGRLGPLGPGYGVRQLGDGPAGR
jgi:uncharacterized membrane protein YgcG